MAGPAFSLTRAIAQGVVQGPRIWPWGAMISKTGGHGDFRFPYEVPASPNAPLSRVEAIGAGAIADGVDPGAPARSRAADAGSEPQLKLAAGDEVVAHYDPIDVSRIYRKPSSALRSTPRKTGAPMSPCTPIRRARSR